MKWAPIRDDGAKSGWAIRGHFEGSQSARIVAFSSQDRGGRTRGHRPAPVITLTQMKWVEGFFSRTDPTTCNRPQRCGERSLWIWGWVGFPRRVSLRLESGWVRSECGRWLFCALAMCFLRSPAWEELYSHLSDYFLSLHNLFLCFCVSSDKLEERIHIHNGCNSHQWFYVRHIGRWGLCGWKVLHWPCVSSYNVLERSRIHTGCIFINFTLSYCVHIGPDQLSRTPRRGLCGRKVLPPCTRHVSFDSSYKFFFFLK